MRTAADQEALWVVGPGMPREPRQLLIDGLGARDGDTVLVTADGRVSIGREAVGALARSIAVQLGGTASHLRLLK